MPGMMEERLLSEKYQGSGCDDFVSILPESSKMSTSMIVLDFSQLSMMVHSG